MPPIKKLTNPPAAAPQTETSSMLSIDGVEYKVIDIRATGDVILDVTFENTSACTKSIPSDLIQSLRTSKTPFPSPRILYRVRLDTLKKHSKYFAHLLGSDVFGEGREIKESFAKLAEQNLKPSEIEIPLLPRIKIVEEDDATRIMGREHVFRDMMRIIHGAEPLTKPINITYLSVLIAMADRYPSTVDRATEDILRQKILIFYHTNQGPKLAAATKELILRGSSRWGVYSDNAVFTTAWWDLPDGLENECAHRRACILRTIASLQTHFLTLYTSKIRQCALGYDSSAACDSFQLGEMIKFFTKKGLLSLVPFQAVSPEDPEYIWPEAYTGDIEQLIGLLRQCPSYQLDKFHTHCGLRVRILPALEHIRDCIESGIGIQVLRWKSDRAGHSWVDELQGPPNGKRKPFVVEGSEDKTAKTFDFLKGRSTMELGANSFNSDQSAKKLFTAEKWIWGPDTEREEANPRLGASFRAFSNSGR